MKGGKKEFERSLGKMWREIALTRVNPAIVTHAPSQPHNVRIRIQRIIERLTWSVFRRGWALFLLKVRVPAPGRAFPRTPDDGEQSLIPGSLQPPRGRQWDAHTRLGRLGSKILQACARTKWGKLRGTLSFLFSDSIVFVFVLRRRRHSSCGRSSLSRFLFLVSYSLFTCTECLYPPSQSSGPRAPTKRARYREATSRLEFRPPSRPPLPSPLPHLTWKPLSYIPVELYKRLRYHGRRDAMYDTPKYMKSRPISDKGTIRSDTYFPVARCWWKTITLRRKIFWEYFRVI